MTYLFMILAGFVMIVGGAFGYLTETHIVVTKTQTQTYIYNETGILEQMTVSPALFEKYELKKKEKSNDRT